MNIKILPLLFCILCIATISDAQAPSAQLMIKEKGFLRSERIVSIELSNQNRQQPLTSDNVNDGPYYYFLVTPAADWELDADIVSENLSKINIYQNEKKIASCLER